MIIKNTAPFLFGRKKRCYVFCNQDNVVTKQSQYKRYQCMTERLTVFWDPNASKYIMLHVNTSNSRPSRKRISVKFKNHDQICAVHMLLVLNWPPAVSLWLKYACKGPCAANMTCFCKNASWVSRLIAQLLWSISVTRF